MEIVGPAWLLRRTLEEALRFADSAKHPNTWAEKVGTEGGLDRMESQALEILALGVKAGEPTSLLTQEVFDGFLGFVTHLQRVQSIKNLGTVRRPRKRIWR